MRVDRRHRHIDHLEPLRRVPFTKENLQVTPHAVSRLRISQRRRFSQNKNPECARRLKRRHDEWLRPARQLRRKKVERKSFILDEHLPPTDQAGAEEIRGAPEAGHAQRRLAGPQQQYRRDR